MVFRDDKISNLYALLIGIDCYLPNKLPNGIYYPSLNGCVRDITLIESFLRSQLGITDERILKLTASNTGAIQSPEPIEEWPTYENMVAAFRKLTNMAKSGDRVYIHYSGHGGRSLTKFPELKTNGFDESLVPTNIGHSETRYLRDIELAYLLQKMVEKELIVTIVLDSCHSGGATRGAGEAVARGIGRIDTTKRATESLVASDKELIATWQLLTQESSRDLTLGNGWLPEPRGYVLLAACRPHESAYEYRADGKQKNGALTYWLVDSLKTMGEKATYQLIYNRLISKIHSQLKLQTPMLQGEGNRIVFGRNRSWSASAVNVMQTKSENQQVLLLLNAGQVQGVRSGTEFAIYPAGVTDFTQLGQRLAIAKITRLGATESWAVISETLISTLIEPGFQAVFLEPGNLRLQSRVCLTYQNKKIVSPTIDQQTALKMISSAVAQSGRGFVTLATEESTVDYQVTINANSEYEIWDSTRQPLLNLRPALRIDEEGVAEHLVQRLVHLTKYRNVKRLDNADPLSPLKGSLEVELLQAQLDFQPGDLAEPQPFDRSENAPIISVGDWMFVRVKNASSRVLNIVALALSCNLGIQQLYPRVEDTSFWPFDPGEEHLLPLRAKLSEGYTEGIEIIKVFATVGATQFRWLELPALDRPLQNNDFYSRAATNSLEEYLAAMMGSELLEEQRKFETDSASLEWVTEQREIIIRH